VAATAVAAVEHKTGARSSTARSTMRTLPPSPRAGSSGPLATTTAIIIRVLMLVILVLVRSVLASPTLSRSHRDIRRRPSPSSVHSARPGMRRTLMDPPLGPLMLQDRITRIDQDHRHNLSNLCLIMDANHNNMAHSTTPTPLTPTASRPARSRRLPRCFLLLGSARTITHSCTPIGTLVPAAVEGELLA
jgi:hypothetical protein